jgi:hypothetical protein
MDQTHGSQLSEANFLCITRVKCICLDMRNKKTRQANPLPRGKGVDTQNICVTGSKGTARGMQQEQECQHREHEECSRTVRALVEVVSSTQSHEGQSTVTAGTCEHGNEHSG